MQRTRAQPGLWHLPGNAYEQLSIRGRNQRKVQRSVPLQHTSSQSRCHAGDSDASLRHKTSSTRISRVLTPKAKEHHQLMLLSQCIIACNRALFQDCKTEKGQTSLKPLLPEYSFWFFRLFQGLIQRSNFRCSQSFLAVSLQPCPHAVLLVPLPHQRQTRSLKTTWIWRFSLVGYKKDPAADPLGSGAAPMEHTVLQQAKREVWKAYGAPS